MSTINHLSFIHGMHHLCCSMMHSEKIQWIDFIIAKLGVFGHKHLDLNRNKKLLQEFSLLKSTRQYPQHHSDTTFTHHQLAEHYMIIIHNKKKITKI